MIVARDAVAGSRRGASGYAEPLAMASLCGTRGEGVESSVVNYAPPLSPPWGAAEPSDSSAATDACAPSRKAWG